MTDRIDQPFGNYRLTQRLGSGGFAEVYLGRHIHLGSEAAVKLLHAQFATASELEQFRTEAQTIASLHHPHIVRLLDFGVEDGTPYLVLDYAPHGSLRQRFLPGSPLPPATILPVVVQVASALQYAHEQQVIHRDVKPENLLLGRNQEVLLTDFGIATVAQNTSQQRTQGVAGTAAYMAPEQLQGKPRPASDLYALGVVVYEWLCGERPFQGGPLEVATQHLTLPPPPPRAKVPDLAPALEHVVLTALAKDPKERFGSVRAFATAFEQACGEAGSAYLLSTQAILPPASAHAMSAAFSQASLALSPTRAQAGTPPEGPGDQAGGSLSSATTHLSPQLTPPLATPSVPSDLLGQAGAALFSEETRLVSPASVPRTDQEEATTSRPSGKAVPATPPAAGWAAQQTGAGPETPLPATSETAYRTKGAVAASDERTLADAPGAHPPETGMGRRKSGFRHWALLAAACLVVLALIGGGVLASIKLIPHSPAPPTAVTGALVTITPASSDVKNSFNLTGVMGSPDASQHQVRARVISVTTSSHSKTVSATGTGMTPGTQASGIADIVNLDTLNPLNLASGTAYQSNFGANCGGVNNRIVVLDAPVSLPAAAPTTPTTPYPRVDVPAHIQQVGTMGNFVQQGGNSGCYGFIHHDLSYCPGTTYGNICWSIASYGDFTGGTDPQPYSVVQQSDIDGAASSLIAANQPNAQQVVQGQLQSDEQLVGTPQCSPNTSEDHQAGDQASQVTVTVSFTCTGLAYDHNGALALGATLLRNQAATTPGAGYALVGQIKTTLVSATPGDQGAVAIVVQAEGIWVYQFSDAQKQALARLIAGKSQQEAMRVLAAQPGVAQARIQIQGGNGQTLPPDTSKITLVIQPVSGL